MWAGTRAGGPSVSLNQFSLSRHASESLSTSLREATSGTGRCAIRGWAMAAGLVGALANPTAGQSPVACVKCHANATFLDGPSAVLYVTDSMVAESQHRGLACASCHPGFDQGFPHRAQATARPCQSCHPAAGEAWAQSTHAANGTGDTPTCVSCHTAHSVYSPTDRRSPTHPLNVAELCGSCHADEDIVGTYFAGPEREQAREAVAQYHATVHGAALTRAGLLVSATCNDCHQAHLVLPADSPASSVHRDNIAGTCGGCHLGVLETFEASAHGAALRAKLATVNHRQAPVCVDCHTSHQLVRADDPEWFLGSSQKCGTCHEELWETYLETYHGKVTNLGFGLTAKCSDCHTPHDMRPASDPASSVFPTNLVSTCAKCHEGANQNFIKFYSHGDHTQRTRYPALFWSWLGMTVLLGSVFVFFGIHTLMWLIRLGLDRVRGPWRPDGEAATDAGAETT